MTRAQRLADDILAYVVAGGGAEAISFIQRNLRTDGWGLPGSLASFEWLCRDLGFTVREGRNSRGQRRIEVTL